MTRYYVAKEFEKRKKLLNDILGGENYQIFDDSNEEEVMHVLNADFDLVILFDQDQTRQHDEFLDYIKSMQKRYYSHNFTISKERNKQGGWGGQYLFIQGFE